MTRTTLQFSRTIVAGSLRLLVGSVIFVWRGATPRYAYQSLIQLFCITRGKSNDLLAKLLGLFHRPYRLLPATGLLGDLTNEEVTKITDLLRDRGYHVFNRRLPADMVDRLVKFALSNECIIRPSDDPAHGAGPRATIFNRAAPGGIIYDFNTEDLVNNPDIQIIMADPSFLAVAQDYIGANPVMSEINLWWMSTYSNRADSQAAQFYHFDMDRIRWLKFFIYLTDVGPDNGPHCFVAGSQRTGGITPRLLSRGYSRLPDEDVREEYAPDSFIEFTGLAGTVIAEDTRGLHKGKPATRGDRLMLQLEFSVSSFGAALPNSVKIRIFHTEAFRNWVLNHPRLFERWLSS